MALEELAVQRSCFGRFLADRVGDENQTQTGLIDSVSASKVSMVLGYCPSQRRRYLEEGTSLFPELEFDRLCPLLVRDEKKAVEKFFHSLFYS